MALLRWRVFGSCLCPTTVTMGPGSATIADLK
ncbi:hypothetical protein BH11PSE4_BH11PSE4_12500 [soil metagenome]